MQIYISYSTSDYNSPYADKYISKVKDIYSECVIINPAEITTPEYFDHLPLMEQMQVFYDEIDKCDLIILLKQQITKKYTPGVIKELEYAISQGIAVIEI